MRRRALASRPSVLLPLVVGAVLAAAPAAAQKAGDYVIVPLSPDPAADVASARAAAPAPGPAIRRALPVVNGVGYAAEAEPNDTSATATPILGASAAINGNVFPNGDVDFYSFTAAAGDRVHAAVMTSFNATSGASTDSQLRLFAPDGTTLIEFDEDDGSLGGLSSSIAGATIPSPGTYYLRVNHFSATNQLRPYRLFFRLQSGAPTAEVEANDTPATANPLPASGWVSGARNPAVATEQDWFSMSLNAGDTVFLSLDIDPERDNVQWNGRLGVALFGDANNLILVVDDNSAGSVTNPLSEALFMTVNAAGTYFAFVDSASAATGGPTATYRLSVTVFPHVDEGINCTTYTSTNVPVTLGPGTGTATSTITVPGNPRIADLDVAIQLNHALMADLDVNLTSPAGNTNGLFTDIGSAATGGQTQMDLTLDDEAAIPPPSFTVMKGPRYTPELAYRLGWFDGSLAGGTWTLTLRDDGANASGGTLTGWSLRICEPPPPPSCAAGFTTQTVFSADFEAGAAGFTHSGTGDQWALGTPNTPGTTTANPVAAFTTCNSGVNCWKTNLTGTYNASTTHDLLSPNINLAGFSPPVVVTWAQRYQMENASFDHLFVDFQQAGGATPSRLFEWLDATMTDVPGNPAVNVAASAGWGIFTRRADGFAGLNTELRFHVDADTTVQLAGLAVDDVTVTACRPLAADLAITKTDGVVTAVPGGNVTYTITASNAGTDPVNPATVADTFPAILTCTWTCVGAGGGTCTAVGAGNINDAVNLPTGASVTYTALCAIAAGATGTLSNTATVTSGVTDPVPGNNSATDTDTLVPSADVAITKTDGVVSATPGGSTTYTIIASNAGPSNAPGSSVADTFPAACTSVNWTCVGAGGGTCTAAGAGNIADTVNLPAGGSVTYTASCNISAGATGSLSNTATVTGSVTDPVPGNNSATDTDTLAPSADLAITKTDGVVTATPGGSTTYTITASNAGPSNAPGSTVADTFPASLTCTWTCVGAGGGTCTAAGAGNINDAVNLPPGGSVTYTASCAIAAGATGSLSNTATVAAPGGVTDPTPGNNSATDTDTLTPSADLAITKTDGVVTATPGGSTTYTITASNAGPSNAPGSTVADTFPASLTCTWTCVGAGGGTCTAAGAGNINDSVNLPSGGSVTYTASCNISAGATGSLVNTATVAAPGGVTDPTPGNNSATDTDALGAQADLAITKTDGVVTATPGGSTTYTITASNAGPSNAPGSTVADTFPASLTCTWTCVGAGGGTCTAAGAGNINDAVNLPSGGSVTYTASCTIAAGATGSLVNTATVTAPGSVTDPTPGNDSATDTDTLAPSADLSITKTDGVASVNSGTTTTYTIVASNAGPSNATGATVADTFPAACTSVSWTCAGAGGGTCTAAGAGNLNDTVNLPAGGSVTYTAACSIALAASGSLVNTATVAAPGGVNDPAPGNDSATDTDTIVQVAVVSGTKTVAPGSYVPGSPIVYTVVLTNTGGAQADNPGNEFVDVLPAQLVLTTASATSGTTVANVGTNTVTWNGPIPGGGSVTITINALIAASASGQTISNQGTISYDADGNGTNEATAVTDDPAVTGGSNPTVFIAGILVTEIPTLSWLGLAGLALALAAAGLLVWRRRM